jgi:hypothetical protein
MFEYVPIASTTKAQLRATFQSYVKADVTSGFVASIHAQKNRAGNTYRVLWRHDGRQRSLTFENLPAAERFKTLLEDHGHTAFIAGLHTTMTVAASAAGAILALFVGRSESTGAALVSAGVSAIDANNLE